MEVAYQHAFLDGNSRNTNDNNYVHNGKCDKGKSKLSKSKI